MSDRDVERDHHWLGVIHALSYTPCIIGLVATGALYNGGYRSVSALMLVVAVLGGGLFVGWVQRRFSNGE